MSFNPKSHTSNPTTHNLAPVTSSYSHQFPISHVRVTNSRPPMFSCNVQSGSSQPPMFSTVQSGSSQPPMFSIYNQACSHVPNVHSPLSPMWNTYMSLKHPANHPSPVLSPSLSNTSMKLGALAKEKEKTEEICNLPIYKNRVLPPRPRILQLLFSSSFSLSCYTGNPM